MKKSLAFLIVLLLAMPGFASAETHRMYAQVADLVSDREFTCYVDHALDASENWHETITVHLSDSLPENTLDDISQQRIVFVSPANYITVGDRTDMEAQNMEPAMYFALINTWSEYDAKANSVVAYVSSLSSVTVDLPDTVNVDTLVTEGETRKVFMFAPYAIDGELYSRHVYAREILFPTFVCGYVTGFGPDYLEVDTLPYEDIRNANQSATRTPMRFALTDGTLAANLLEEGLETVVVYDEDTMEAIALFFFYG